MPKKTARAGETLARAVFLVILFLFLFSAEAVVAEGVGKFAQQVFLLVGEACRGGDADSDELVAAAAAAQVCDAFASEPENRACLRAFRDIVFDLTVERWDFNLGAECGLDDGDRHVIQDGRPLAREERVTRDAYRDVKVARLAAVDTGAALTAERNGLAVVDTGWDADLDGFISADETGAPALLAGLMDDFSAPFALGAV